MPSLRRRVIAFFCVWTLITGTIPPPIVAAAAVPLWTFKPGPEIKWHDLTGLGTILVGTEQSLICLDQEKGTVVWKRDDLRNVPKYQVEEIAGTPLLLATSTEGGKAKLFALDISSGESIWETEKIKGAAVGMIPVYSKNLVILLTSRSASQSKDKPDMIALNMTTGAVAWEREFPDKVDFHATDTSGKYFVKYDLSGHADPVVEGDSIFFTYAGLHHFDLNTGKLLWGLPYDVTEGKLKKGNARAFVDGDTVYTSAKGVIRAHDKTTGMVKWTSKDFGGAVAEMTARGDRIFGRMGGHFFEYKKREWVLEKPLGLVAVDKKSGSMLWRYDKAQDGITNMALLPEGDVALIADAKSLIGIDSTGKEAFQVKLEFKHKIGAGAKAAKTSMKLMKGGLLGLAKKDNSDLDLPVAIELRENGTAVVRGKQHILAFDPKTKQIPWSLQFPAPGVSGWQLAVMATITAMQYGYHFAGASSTYLGTYGNTWHNNQKSQAITNYEKLFNKRFTATKAEGNYVYVLTNVEEGDESGAGLVAVNMNTGVTANELLLKMKELDYTVDELTGRIFNLKDKRELSAYTIRASTP